MTNEELQAAINAAYDQALCHDYSNVIVRFWRGKGRINEQENGYQHLVALRAVQIQRAQQPDDSAELERMRTEAEIL